MQKRRLLASLWNQLCSLLKALLSFLFQKNRVEKGHHPEVETEAEGLYQKDTEEVEEEETGKLLLFKIVENLGAANKDVLLTDTASLINQELHKFYTSRVHDPTFERKMYQHLHQHDEL